MDNAKTIEAAKAAIDLQSESLELTRQALDQSFVDAVRLIAYAPKVITTGLGKSGFIAKKMAATLSSVRIPAVYIHPVDAVHGDSGLLSDGDVMVAFSKSGETAEVIRFMRIARELGVSVVGIASRRKTTLQSESQAFVLAPITSEYDLHSVLPTASTTAALVIADLLAVQAVQERGDVLERLQASHPEGAIGTALLRTVDEVMHGGDSLPSVNIDATVGDVLEKLSSSGLGIVCICDENMKLHGILTDGDIRRLVSQGKAEGSIGAITVMTSSPVVVEGAETLHAALRLMENQLRQLNVVPVVSGEVCVGVLRLHDVVKANM